VLSSGSYLDSGRSMRNPINVAPSGDWSIYLFTFMVVIVNHTLPAAALIVGWRRMVDECVGGGV
jgi:hypothetical protein